MSEKVHISAIFDETGCLNLQGMRGYLEGSLKRQERAAAAEHLEECELCAEAIGGIEMETDDRLVLSSVAAITAAVREKSGSGEKVGDSGEDGSDSGGSSTAWIWQTSAAAVVLLLIGIGIVMNGDEGTLSPNKQQNEVAAAEKTAPKEEVKGEAKDAVPLIADGAENKDKGTESDADMVGSGDLVREDQVLDEVQVVAEEIEEKVVFAESFDREEEVSESLEDMAYDDFADQKSNVPQKETANAKNVGGSLANNRQAVTRDALATGNVQPSRAENTSTVPIVTDNRKVDLDLVTDEDEADLNQGYLTDVYKVEDNEARYAGTKQLSKKSKSAPASSDAAPAADVGMAKAEEIAGAEPLDIAAPSPFYFDTDKSSWSRTQTLVDAGMQAYASSDFAEAIRNFDLAIQSDPENETARFYSGISYFELSLYNNAEKQFDVLIDKKNVRYGEESLWYKAEILVRRQEISRAKKVLKALVKLQGDYSKRAAERLEELE